MSNLEEKIDQILELVKKPEPVKVLVKKSPNSGDYWYGFCGNPNCSSGINYLFSICSYSTDYTTMKHCKYCGCLLDSSDVEVKIAELKEQAKVAQVITNKKSEESKDEKIEKLEEEIKKLRKQCKEKDTKKKLWKSVIKRR